MRKILLISITGLLALGLTYAPGFSAQVGDIQKNNEALKAKVLQKYDLNGNGVLDPEELQALKEDNEAMIQKAKERVRERLERYDLNKNGKLDPEERELMLRE
jgi:Ca2+-binding EF-hand superfamily protein